MSLTKVSYSMIQGAAYNVLDYGAAGDGITDDTAAIRACIAAAIAATVGGSGGVYGPVGSTGIGSGSGPAVYFPKGVYKITDYLTANTNQAVNYLQFIGENALIVPSADTIRVFGGVGFNVSFYGLVFRGGAYAIGIKSNNIDTAKISVANCEFINQKQYCIETDTTSNSTLLNISNCKFSQSDNTVSPGGILNLQTADFVNVKDCWVSGFTAVPFINKTQLWMKNVYCTPNTGLSYWIENYAAVYLESCTFGGEDGGHPAVRNYAAVDTSYPITGTVVKIVNCSTQSSSYVVELYALPNILWIEGSTPNVDSLGVYFHSTLTGDQFLEWSKYGICNIQNNFVSGQYSQLFPINNSTAGNLGYMTTITMMARTNQINTPIRDRMRSTDVFGSGGFGGGWSTITSGVTFAFGTSPYGGGTAETTLTSATGTTIIYADDYLTQGVLTGQSIYTFQLIVSAAVAKGCRIDINVGGANRQFNLASGRHVLSVPFVYWNSTGGANPSYDALNISVSGRTIGDVITLERHMLFAGFMQTSKEILVMEAASGSPSAYTDGIGYSSGYYVGDINWRTNPASGAAPGDVCTVAGNAGTWKAMANLA